MLRNWSGDFRRKSMCGEVQCNLDFVDLKNLEALVVICASLTIFVEAVVECVSKRFAVLN